MIIRLSAASLRYHTGRVRSPFTRDAPAVAPEVRAPCLGFEFTDCYLRCKFPGTLTHRLLAKDAFKAAFGVCKGRGIVDMGGADGLHVDAGTPHRAPRHAGEPPGESGDARSPEGTCTGPLSCLQGTLRVAVVEAIDRGGRV